MTETFTPRPHYAGTSVRPGWTDLPPSVRALVGRRLGGPAAARPSAGGGFTPGFAALVRGPAGTEFVKAVDAVAHPYIADCYRREAAINRALPAAVPAPALRWVEESAGWVVLGFDPVPGARMPADPWRPEELTAALDACATVAEALARPSRELLALDLRPLRPEPGEEDFDDWRRLAGGGPGAELLPDWFPRGLIEPLAALEAGWVEATAGEAVLHEDLRRDNIVLDGAGRAWICDWNWPRLGASWFDLTLLLATARADGHDADRLFGAHPAARGAAPEQLDAALAALTGYFLRSGGQPDPPSGSRMLRRHQTWSGEVTLRWLAARRGWRV
ncbi:aminoglycoside phosphotransferase family protein [Kitasatospora sp. NPDC057015]|uniref:aminoglycoside phosphotransferase family protein n=1 Tax=Kitasatospora sp. NPDC057015 TaxID=3346001 RepID=UPI003629D805